MIVSAMLRAQRTLLINLLVDEVKAPAGKILTKWRPHFLRNNKLIPKLTSTIENTA